MIVLLAVVWRVDQVVAVPLGYIFFGALFSIFSPQRSFFLYCLTCEMCLRFRGCPVVLGSELSVSARHQKTRTCTAVRAASCALACCSSSERRCAAQISKLQAMRVKQNNEFGPIRALETNDFWRPTTAKLPLQFTIKDRSIPM